MKKIQIQDYIQFLKSENHFKWNFWSTITTQSKLTYKSAQRLVERFVNNLKKYLLRNRNYNEYKSNIFFVIEPFEYKKGVHIHFLLECPKSIRFKLLRSLWNQALGFSMGETACRIEAFHQEEHVYLYLAKKLVLRRVEYDFININTY